jgi:hypothetical protein
VTEGFKVQTGRQTIRIRPTHQRLSAQAGQTIFWGFLHRLKVREKLAALLPHRRTSPNALAPVEIALSFISGVLAGATKLARVSWLRSDSLLAEVMEIKRLPSPSTLSRFFAAFTKPQEGGACWRGLWRWGMEQLSSRPGGFALDLDSTTLCHDGLRQEGVQLGYTPQGIRRCLHPLLAVLAEAKLCVQFWLRPGRANSGNNVVGFTEELLANLPSHVRLRLIRADSGFQNERWFELLESRGLRYIVVADFSQRLQSFVRAQTRWIPTGLAGLEVADVVYESHTGLGPRRHRLILIRRQVQANPEGLGRLLLECPGYRFQALLTNLPASVGPLQVWREYNQRADMENVIKELKHGFGLGDFCCRGFYATEAALCLAVFTYNLTVLFCRRLGWLERVTIGTLRYRLFQCAGIVSRSQGQLTLRLALSAKAWAWWRTLWEKLLNPFPNCNAVPQTP